eukprot:6224337-Pyramimonas_sp.AAC.1
MQIQCKSNARPVGDHRPARRRRGAARAAHSRWLSFPLVVFLSHLARTVTLQYLIFTPAPLAARAKTSTINI